LSFFLFLFFSPFLSPAPPERETLSLRRRKEEEEEEEEKKKKKRRWVLGHGFS